MTSVVTGLLLTEAGHHADKSYQSRVPGSQQGKLPLSAAAAALPQGLPGPDSPGRLCPGELW